MNNKAFCFNLLCNRKDRTFVCSKCNVHLCSMCNIKATDKKIYCVNCYINPSIDWARLNAEFDLMLMPKKEEEEKTNEYLEIENDLNVL